MRSADRRKAFFAVCMMAVLLFSHLGVCLWQTQIAQVQNLTAEAGGEAQGILRTTVMSQTRSRRNRKQDCHRV